MCVHVRLSPQKSQSGLRSPHCGVMTLCTGEGILTDCVPPVAPAGGPGMRALSPLWRGAPPVGLTREMGSGGGSRGTLCFFWRATEQRAQPAGYTADTLPTGGSPQAQGPWNLSGNKCVWHICSPKCVPEETLQWYYFRDTGILVPTSGIRTAAHLSVIYRQKVKQ